MVISADSKVHFRPVKDRQPFRGIVGIALWIHDVAQFKTALDGVLERFFADNRLQRVKKVYSASEIAGLFPGPPWKLRGLLRKLARELISMRDTHINAYFLTLDLNELRDRKLPKPTEGAQEEEEKNLQAQGMDAKIVQIYGEPGREAVEYVTPSDFFEKVGQYFPVVCVHKLCTFLDVRGEDIVIDGCTGPRSKAWDGVTESENRLTILTDGDTYNPYISAADILTRWIDEELRQGRLPLNQNALNRIMTQWTGVTSDLDTSHIHIVHISNKDLGDVKPLSKERIERFQWAFTRHPAFYMFQESTDNMERARVENSPLMPLVHNRIFDRDGSCIWWRPDLHTRMISNGDIAVVYGDNGLAEARRLKTLRYPIDIWDLRNEKKEGTQEGV